MSIVSSSKMKRFLQNDLVRLDKLEVQSELNENGVAGLLRLREIAITETS